VARREGSTWSLAGTPSLRSAAGTTDVFAGWHIDPAAGPFVENDRHGIHPFFYSSATHAISLSTSIGSLLRAGIPATLDDAAMAVFLRTGFFVGDDTPFAAIRAMPPAARLRGVSDNVAFESAWRAPSAAALSRADAVVAFGEAFSGAIDRALSNARAPVAVLLSGGHDSRHILLAMVDAGQLPDRAVTVHPYPPHAANDVEVARRVAAAAGVRHVLLAQRTNRIAAEREKNRLTHFCADEHAQFLPLRDYFDGERCAVFDGLAGDVLSQSQRLDPALHRLFLDGRFDAVADAVLGDPASIEPALANLLTRDAYRRFDRSLAAARVAAEAARYGGAPNPIAAFFFFTRTRREIALAPFGILSGHEVHTPFLDRAVTDLLLSLPFDLVSDRRLHSELMERRYPRFAAIPFGGKERSAPRSMAARRQAAQLLGLTFESSTLVDIRAVRLRAARALASGDSDALWFVPRIVHLLDVASAGRQDNGYARR
jgi:hypothetical protein